MNPFFYCTHFKQIVNKKRWIVKLFPWVSELIRQKVKNVVKNWMTRMSSLAGTDD